MKIEILTHRTRAKHKTMITLLDEIRDRAGFGGIATHSQYRGRHYPVLCLGDFTGNVASRTKQVFLGISPMKVNKKGEIFHAFTGRFVIPKGEWIAVWR